MEATQDADKNSFEATSKSWGWDRPMEYDNLKKNCMCFSIMSCGSRDIKNDVDVDVDVAVDDGDDSDAGDAGDDGDDGDAAAAAAGHYDDCDDASGDGSGGGRCNHDGFQVQIDLK